MKLKKTHKISDCRLEFLFEININQSSYTHEFLLQAIDQILYKTHRFLFYQKTSSICG